MRLHIGKAFNSLKLTNYLEEEKRGWEESGACPPNEKVVPAPLPQRSL